MGKQLNPLEKEFLIRTYRAKTEIPLNDFCYINNVSIASMKKWMRIYEEGGLDALARQTGQDEILPEGVDRTEENYKREILKLRIENERLIKNYTVQKTEDGQTVFIPFKAEEFEIIKTLSYEYSIKTLCEAMEVSRARYYKWLNKKTTKKDIKRAEAVELVTRIHEAHKSHGYR